MNDQEGKDVKMRFSVASGNASASFRNVSIDTIYQAIFLLVSNASKHKATCRFLFYKRL